MRRRRLTFRIGTPMILLAVVATVLGRFVHFSRLARHHESERRALIPGDLEVYLVMTPTPRGLPMHPESGHPIVQVVAPIREFVAYHLELEKKYDDASLHPWLPVPSDPPPPPKPSKARMAKYRGWLEDSSNL